MSFCSQRLDKTLQHFTNFTKLHSTINNTNLYKIYTTLHNVTKKRIVPNFTTKNFTTLRNAAQNYTKLQQQTKHTQLYTKKSKNCTNHKQNFIQLYKTCTQLYKSFRTKKAYNSFSTTLQHCTTLYTTLQNCTQLHKTLQSATTFHNLTTLLFQTNLQNLRKRAKTLQTL